MQFYGGEAQGPAAARVPRRGVALAVLSRSLASTWASDSRWPEVERTRTSRLGVLGLGFGSCFATYELGNRGAAWPIAAPAP